MENQDHPAQTLAIDLINRESVTPNDAGCQSSIIARLEAIGFTAKDYSSGDITNTWLTHGQGRPCVVLAGHTDVVPAGELTQWRTPPFEAVCKDNTLYGRGACDMKGAVAAMVVALEALVTHSPNHPGTLALALTSDEEGPAIDGMRHLIESLGNQPIDYVITGEPTCSDELGDTIKVGRRGSLHGTLTLHGKQGHIAYPDKANNAIHLAAPILNALSNQQWPSDNAFPKTQLQFYDIQSGAGATNVIPGTLTASFNCRFGTTPGEQTIKRDIINIIEQYTTDYECEWTLSAAPFLTAPGVLIETAQAAIQQKTGKHAIESTSGGTSDSRFWATRDCEVIDFGLINETIHQVNEHICIDHLPILTDLYYDIAKNLLNHKKNNHR